ncbi:hypothetical protein DFJ73DRAFT_921267 [Zopfochytrium polystomum]|nr:hypothetical protein DFJ73DRAFT_921267 [Zopfochytrium polystomum]
MFGPKKAAVEREEGSGRRRSASPREGGWLGRFCVREGGGGGAAGEDPTQGPGRTNGADELRRAEGGAAALGATNFRGLAAMALALDVVVCAQDPLEELTDLCGAAAEDAFGLDDDVFLQIDAAAAARSPAAAADIVGLLLDAGADPAGLVQLFRDDGDGWWQRPATSMGGGNGSWSAYHLDRLLWNIEAVFSGVDEARRRRCLEWHELARAVAMRASDAGFEVVDEDEFCEKRSGHRHQRDRPTHSTLDVAAKPPVVGVSAQVNSATGDAAGFFSASAEHFVSFWHSRWPSPVECALMGWGRAGPQQDGIACVKMSANDNDNDTPPSCAASVRQPCTLSPGHRIQFPHGAPISPLAPAFRDRTRIVAYIADHRSLACLSCASKSWSVLAFRDEHWRPLFLAQWTSPRMRTADAHGGGAGNPAGGTAQLPPVEDVAWKKLYEYRLALESDGPVGTQSKKCFPSRFSHILCIDSNYIVLGSLTGYEVVRRSDFRAIQTLPAPPSSRVPDALFPGAAVNAESTAILTAALDRGEVHLRDFPTAPRECIGWIGTFIYSACPRRANLWNGATGALLENLPFANCSWSTNGCKLFSLSADGSIRIWSPTTGAWEPRVLVPGNPNNVRLGSLLANGKLVALKWPRDGVSVWNVATGVLVSTTTLEAENFFSPIIMNGKRVFKAPNEQIKVWDIPSGSQHYHQTWEGVSGNLCCSARGELLHHKQKAKCPTTLAICRLAPQVAGMLGIKLEDNACRGALWAEYGGCRLRYFGVRGENSPSKREALLLRGASCT